MNKMENEKQEVEIMTPEFAQGVYLAVKRLQQVRLEKARLEKEEAALRKQILKAHPEDCEVRLEPEQVLVIKTVETEQLDQEKVRRKLGPQIRHYLTKKASRRIEVVRR